jgi:hypothetical protein
VAKARTDATMRSGIKKLSEIQSERSLSFFFPKKSIWQVQLEEKAKKSVSD